MPDHAPIRGGARLAEALRQTGLPPLETRVLVAHALQLSRVQLITQSERVLSDSEAQRLMALFQRRLQGEPIAYILGVREFYGLALEVTPEVLIPRPETELLVDLALERLPQNGRMLDMGTGSGAIAIAVAHARRDAHVTALDLSAGALEVARRNAMRHGAHVRLLQSDWYEAVSAARFDLIASNPPYIRQGDAHLAQGDLRFEPRGALTDHATGLTALAVIIGGANQHLQAGGWLLVEHGYDQGKAVRDLFAAHRFESVRTWQDLAGIDRVTGGVPYLD